MSTQPKIIRLIGIAGVLSLALTACGGAGSGGDQSQTAAGDGSNVTIQALFNMPAGSPQEDVMRQIIKEYEADHDVTIEMEVPASYEEVLKVRMAAQDVPDIFSTHGWSIMRYKEFLTPLTDQPWVEHLNPGLDATVKDENGDIYTLPLEFSVTGLVTNFDVLDKAGIDPETITTWDEFTTAGKKLKEAGIIPIAAPGKESGDGNLADFIASGWFSADELDKFAAGTFVTDEYTAILTQLSDWADMDFYNPDYSSATVDDAARMLAMGKAAFTFYQPTIMTQALEYDETANIGFIPFPGRTSDERYLIGGEGLSAFGVSNTSKHPEVALDFLNYLAQPEVASTYVSSLGTYSGLTNVEVDLGLLSPSYEKWVKPGDVPTHPFFDRAYLPSGMWSAMKSTADAAITQQETPEQAVQTMVSQFDSLYAKK